MTRLHDDTLRQVTTAYATAIRHDDRTHFERTTAQLVYVALAELQERRHLDAAMLEVLKSARGVVARSLEEHTVHVNFEVAMAKLELALFEFDELRVRLSSQPAEARAQRLATTPEG